MLDTQFAAGYLHNFYWGCEDDFHTGWAIIESENREQALMVVPPNLRNSARAIKLRYYDRASAETAHQKIHPHQE
ncbi:MAG: hypothetical protein V3U49_01480 [Nitrososphaerales archaeon]